MEHISKKVAAYGQFVLVLIAMIITIFSLDFEKRETKYSRTSAR